MHWPSTSRQNQQQKQQQRLLGSYKLLENGEEGEEMEFKDDRWRYNRRTIVGLMLGMMVLCAVLIATVLVPIIVASKLVDRLPPQSAHFQSFAVAVSGFEHPWNQNGSRLIKLLPIKPSFNASSIPSDYVQAIRFLTDKLNSTTPLSKTTTEALSPQLVNVLNFR